METEGEAKEPEEEGGGVEAVEEEKRIGDVDDGEEL